MGPKAQAAHTGFLFPREVTRVIFNYPFCFKSSSEATLEADNNICSLAKVRKIIVEKKSFQPFQPSLVGRIGE
jgi:hypothetical protein